MMIKLLALVSVLLLSSCGGNANKAPRPTDTSIANSKIPLTAPKETYCETLLSQLVKSSNATAFKHFSDTAVKARMVYISPEKATIKLYVIQDISENPVERRLTEQAVGWLEFYRQGGKLMDITNDPDKPEELRYDKAILKGQDLFASCGSVTAVAKPGSGYESRDVMLEKDLRFNGNIKRFFTLAEFEKIFGKPDSVRLLKDEAPCISIFNTEAPDDKYLYKNGSRFETSGDSVAVDEYWFLNGNFITYKGIRIDANTSMDDIKQLFPTAVSGRLGMDKEGKLWFIKLREDSEGVSDGHIKLFFKNGKVYFMHWWLPC
jgi:hypothetical protein